jgi:hypothetical protein
VKTELVTASKLQAGDRVKQINEILTIVKSESHPTHKRYQVLTMRYPEGEPWDGYTATRECAKVSRYERVLEDSNN